MRQTKSTGGSWQTVANFSCGVQLLDAQPIHNKSVDNYSKIPGFYFILFSFYACFLHIFYTFLYSLFLHVVFVQ